MLKTLVLPAFLILAVAQWFVPGFMIWQKEKVLDKGIPYKFQSAPVDPADPFRGRYIVLNFKETSFRTKDSLKLTYGAKIYVTFSNDQDGFARIHSVAEKRPEGQAYLETTLNSIWREKDTTIMEVNYPFNVFYLEEYKAPKAETMYRESAVDSARRTYALVNILNGDAVVKDVYINDTSIHELIRTRSIQVR